jgi:hypothetical protein
MIDYIGYQYITYEYFIYYYDSVYEAHSCEETADWRETLL